MEEKENLFKCPNDLKVKISKDNGELVLDESCCTNLSIIVKNTGEIATSFFGAHNPAMLKVLDKTLKSYFKSIKKTLRAEYKRADNEEITVIKNGKETNSKEIEKALEKEVDVKIKYEFESLKEIEEHNKLAKNNITNKEVGKTYKSNGTPKQNKSKIKNSKKTNN
ncbi:MAG: hypothetical protein ACI4PF_03380 [Christensenellales bacterium]